MSKIFVLIKSATRKWEGWLASKYPLHKNSICDQLHRLCSWFWRCITSVQSMPIGYTYDITTLLCYSTIINIVYYIILY